MTTRTRATRLALLSTAATLAICLAPPAPASAAPVFDDVGTLLYYQLGGEVAGVDCAQSSSTSGPPQPVVENGAATTAHNVVTFSGTHSATPIASGTVSATATGSVTSAGGLPRSIDLSASGQGQVTFSQAGSGCTLGGGLQYQLNFLFSLSAPAYLDLRTTITGRATALVILDGSAAPFADGFTVGFTGSETTRVLLPAGQYSGRFGGGPTMRATNTATSSGSATLHGVFTPLGAQLTAPAGKGGTYVSLPAAATCSPGTIEAHLTSAKKPAKRVRSVLLQVGDLKRRVHAPKRGQSLSLPFAGDQPQTVTATVTLRPKHRGRKPQVLVVGAAYEACS